MRWAQFVNFTMIFSMNPNTKEYMVASKIYTPRLVGALQMKDDRVPPDITVPISDSLTNDFNMDFKTMSSQNPDYGKKKK